MAARRLAIGEAMSAKSPHSPVVILRRRRAAVCGGVLGAAGIVLLASQFLPLSSQPSIPSGVDPAPDGEMLKIDPPEVTVRRSRLQESSRHEIVFRLTNPSPRAIVLKSITSKCACTVPAKPANPLLVPGAGLSMPVRVDVPTYGVRDTRIEIELEGEPRRTFHIPIRLIGMAAEPPYAEIVPQRLELWGSMPGEAARREFEIVTHEVPDSEPWLTAFESKNSALRAVVLTPPSSKELNGIAFRTYSCLVEADVPSDPLTPTTGDLQLVTSSAGSKPSPKIFVSVAYRPSVRVAPSEVFFTFEDEQRERVVTMASESGEAFDIELLAIDVAWLEAEILPSEDAALRLVRIRVTESPTAANPTTGTQRHFVRVRTSLAESRELAIPVTVQLP